MFVRYAFLADSVMLDVTGKISANGIFDNIFCHSFPARHRDMTLVANLEATIAEKGSHKILIELRDNDANRLASLDQEINFVKQGTTQDSLKAGLIVKIQDILFQKPGHYEFVLFGDNRFLGRVLFSVLKINMKVAGDA